MVESAAGASVMMNVIRAVTVAAGGFIGIDAVHALSAGTGGISVVVNVAVEDLVVVGPNGDSASRAIFDFKSVHDVVAAIDVDADVPIGSVLSIDHGSTGNLRLEGDWAGG